MVKPKILREGEYDKKALVIFKKRAGVNSRLVDIFDQQLKELFGILNPPLRGDSKELARFIRKRYGKDNNLAGDWIFYQWDNLVLHTVTETEYEILLTNRNKILIDQYEQERLSEFTVAIAGLSVGGGIATTLIQSGFSKQIKLSDFDVIETSNLNRLRGGLPDVGSAKIDVLQKQIYFINPYARVIPFHKLTIKNVDSFVSNKPKPRLIFEEIDDFRMKVVLRQYAKRNKVPVVTLTSLGDSVLFDIERYDIDKSVAIFNGRLKEQELHSLSEGQFTEAQKQKLAISIVGSENVPSKAKQSIGLIGHTLVGRPQLLSTVTVVHGLSTYVVRMIALGKFRESGRYSMKFSELLKR